MTKTIILCFLVCFLFSPAKEIFSRVKIYYKNCEQIEELIQSPEISVLKHQPNSFLEIIVEHSCIHEFMNAGFKYEVVIDDVALYYQELLINSRGGVFGNYYLYSEILQECQSLQSQYPSIFKLDSLAIRSIEDRALYLVKISSSPDSNNTKPQALISGAMHAYEPIGPSVCMSDIMHLCENYATDPEIQWLVNNRQIYFIPVINPDGYVFNETYPTRMWRKNRRLNSGGSYGVDLNRNFPYKWGYDDIGSSPNAPAWNYRGTASASEPETQSTIDFVDSHQIRTWHNHHSPGDVLLIPFSYINSYPWDDTLEYFTMCREETAIYGFFDWGNSSQAYGYACNGELADWAWCDSATYKIFGLVPELGMDYWEGIADSSKIVDVCQRMLGAEIYLMQVAGFFPVFSSFVVIDTFTGGNDDGILNPGERAHLQITIDNKAVVDTGLGLSGYLNTSYPYLNVTDSVGTYGDVIRLATANNESDPFAVACSSAATPYDWIYFDLRLVWDSGDYEKVVVCSLQLGPVGIEEEQARQIRANYFIPTIFSGSLQILADKKHRVFDITGREVDVNHLAHGVYFVEIDGEITKKVVKIR